MSTGQVAETKRRLALPFHEKERVDVALATNMISVGLDQRERAAALFGPLAARMDEEPELSVRLFLNVERKYRDETADSVLLRGSREEHRGGSADRRP